MKEENGLDRVITDVRAEMYDYGSFCGFLFRAQGKDPEHPLIISKTEWKEEPKNCCYTPPFLTLEPKVVQRLVDELWRHGFKPTKILENEGQVNAQSKHLADMRCIAGKFLKLELP